ncbi:site-specific integrase [Paraburkholderia bryophila]|uniref:tyrosine-type recombinase/integrase n=1 Tax=Paraburkholderia bryophila TaxID=420952 RepID=UPI0038BD822B
MASIHKTEERTWRAQVAKRGVRLSGTFSTKAAATAWAVEKESEIMKGTHQGAGSRTVADLFDEYAKRVSNGKLGGHWELTRFKAFKKNFPDLAAKLLTEVSSHDWGIWRDARLGGTDAMRPVGAGSVIREVNLFSAAFQTACKEWKWIAASPLTDMKRPKDPLPRARVYRQEEIDRLILCAGYEFDQTPTTKTARVACALLFALETAMRAGEIVGMDWKHVDEKRRFVHLPRTKTGIPRDVPLSPRALEIIGQLRPLKDAQEGAVFGLDSDGLAALFQKIKTAAGIDGATFHDTRRTALTRMAKIFSVLELAKISGHRDIRILSEVYYAPEAADLALKLAAASA